MKPDIYTKTECAGITCKNFTAYYGYQSLENGDWCFEAEFDGTKIKIPFRKMQSKDMYNCKYNLLLGIAWLFQKYKLIY